MGLPFPPPVDVPPGIKPLSPALVGGFLTIKPIGNPNEILLSHNNTLNLPFATTWRILCLAKCQNKQTNKQKNQVPRYREATSGYQGREGNGTGKI